MQRWKYHMMLVDIPLGVLHIFFWLYDGLSILNNVVLADYFHRSLRAQLRLPNQLLAK